MNRAFVGEACNFNALCKRRGFHDLKERMVEYVAELIEERYWSRRRNMGLLSLDHIISHHAVISPKHWKGLTVQEKVEWAAFIREWEHVGRLPNGYFWIASGLHCKANLRLILKVSNNRKRQFIS